MLNAGVSIVGGAVLQVGVGSIPLRVDEGEAPRRDRDHHIVHLVAVKAGGIAAAETPLGDANLLVFEQPDGAREICHHNSRPAWALGDWVGEDYTLQTQGMG